MNSGSVQTFSVTLYYQSSDTAIKVLRQSLKDAGISYSGVEYQQHEKDIRPKIQCSCCGLPYIGKDEIDMFIDDHKASGRTKHVEVNKKAAR